MANPDNPNPLSRHFSSIAKTFLGEHIGEPVTPDLIHNLGSRLLEVEVKLSTVRDIQDRISISQQRISQLTAEGSLPPEVAILPRGVRLWMETDIDAYCQARLANPPKRGRPKRGA